MWWNNLSTIRHPLFFFVFNFYQEKFDFHIPSMNMIYRPHTARFPALTFPISDRCCFPLEHQAFLCSGAGCGIPLEGGSVGRCVCVPLPDVTAVTVGVEQLSRVKIEWMSWASPEGWACLNPDPRLFLSPQGARRDSKAHRFPTRMGLICQGKELRLYSIDQGEPPKLLRRQM